LHFCLVLISCTELFKERTPIFIDFFKNANEKEKEKEKGMVAWNIIIVQNILKIH